MELGIFMLLAGVLFGLGAIYDELKAIHKTLEAQPCPQESTTP